MMTDPNEREELLACHGIHWIVMAKPFLFFMLSAGITAYVQLFLVLPGGQLFSPGTSSHRLSIDSEELTYLSLMLTILAGLALLRMIVVRRSMFLNVTSRRIIGKSGIWTLSMIDLPLSRIGGISIFQSFWGCALGYGTVTVEGLGGQVMRMSIIDNPQSFRDVVSRACTMANHQSALPR